MQKMFLSSDKTKEKRFQKTNSKINENKVNIIIGTQIISKGHNFPFLKTVGIINIDNLMNDFDFRSNEKAFQQIVQVAGRAGRKNINGEVLIQTFQPYHPVIKLSKRQNVIVIYYELNRRKENHFPLFKFYIINFFF